MDTFEIDRIAKGYYEDCKRDGHSEGFSKEREDNVRYGLLMSEQTQKMFDIKSLAQIGFGIADYEAGAISDRETIFRVIAGIAKAGLKDTAECEKAFNHWQESQKLKAAEEEAKGNKPYYFK